MDEFNRTARDPAPPSPPRWKGTQSLDLVHQLNQRCIGLLCDLASANVPRTTLQIVTENREHWVRLEPEARQRVACVPFIIVDAQFKNEEWWGRVADSRFGEGRVQQSHNGLPHEASEHLMHETTMFAWQTARWDRAVAQMSFIMSPSVAEIVSALTPQQIREIASHESQCIQIRWADDARFWQDILIAAMAADDEKLAELQLHAKLALLGELARHRE